MKLLHLIDSVNPSAGGPVESIRQLAGLHTLQGHKVEVVSLDPPNAPWIPNWPVTVHSLGPSSLRYAYTRRLVPWLRANLQRFDLVVVHGIWQYQALAAHRALRGTATPYVVFAHGMLDPWFKKRYPLKHLKKCLYWPWGPYRVLRDAQAVLFTCHEEMLLARQSFHPYKAREIIVSLGTAGPPNYAVTQHSEFFERYPDLRGKRLVLFMGRIHEKKGCDLLVEAFGKTLSKDPLWHLVIAGPDEVGWQAILASRAAGLRIHNRITWTGMIAGAMKWDTVRAAEVFVLPSHQENFGVAVAEALACSVPVLITDKVNIWREIARASAGLVGEDSVSGVCEMLSNWAAMAPAQQAEMRQNARACFEEFFEIGPAAERFLQAARPA